MKITIVTTTVEDGLYDEGYPPRVYEGHLTDAQIDQIIREFGNIGKGGYHSYTVWQDEDGLRVQFSNEPWAAYDADGGFAPESRGSMELHVVRTVLVTGPGAQAVRGPENHHGGPSRLRGR